MEKHQLAGQRFGRLTAVKYVKSNEYGKTGKWLCACDCGMSTMVLASDLVHGRTKSCGCLHRESTIERSTKHGKAHKERLYDIWYAMKQRCYYNGSAHRKNYSMKGIKVCDEWRDNYSEFRKWAYANGYVEQPPETPHRERLSIDRIDPNKDYCPENCQWISCDANLKKRFTDKAIRPEVRQG